MKWEKGRQKTGGRALGVPNQVTRDIKAIAQGLVEDPAYQASLKRRLLKGSSPQLEVLLHYYAYGKPKTVIAEDKTITIIIDRCEKPDPMVIEHQSGNTDEPSVGEPKDGKEGL